MYTSVGKSLRCSSFSLTAMRPKGGSVCGLIITFNWQCQCENSPYCLAISGDFAVSVFSR